MSRSLPLSKSDLVGGTRLVTEAVGGLADLVEAMHARILSATPLRPTAAGDRARGLTGFVYGAVRTTAGWVGSGLEAVLERTMSETDDEAGGPAREAAVAVLNGVFGDHLAQTGNPLATPMTLRSDGAPLPDDPAAVAVLLPEATAGVAVLVHGLCMNDLQWTRDGRDRGVETARSLGLTPLALRYSTGRHVSINGRALAERLERLVETWPRPLERLVLIGHSMGGLVARSAVHYGREAGHRWPERLSDLVFLGTPHHGAPLERVGNWVDVALGATSWVAPLARLGKARSAGITDLREGSLVDEDWADGDRFSPKRGRHRHLPLPEGPRCHAVAAALGKGDGRLADGMVGDGLVPVDSALGRHRNPHRHLRLPPAQVRVVRGLGHLDLLWSEEVWDQVRRWLDRPGVTAASG